VLPCKWGCGDTETENDLPQGIDQVGDKIDLNLWSQKFFFLGYSREKVKYRSKQKCFLGCSLRKRYRVSCYLE